ALVNRAEAIQDSIQWRETTEELTEMMTQWKSIGPVPREQSNKIWNRFLEARNHFFGRKDADREKRKARMEIHKQIRDKQTAHHLISCEEQLKEEQAKLSDFEQALQNVSGPKAEQLKAHLTTLITETK